MFRGSLDGKDVAVKKHSAKAGYQRELKNLQRLYRHENLVNLVAVISDAKQLVVVELVKSPVGQIVYNTGSFPNIPLVRWCKEICRFPICKGSAVFKA